MGYEIENEDYYRSIYNKEKEDNEYEASLYQSENEDIDDKISRLKTAMDLVKAEKKDFKVVKKDVPEIIDSKFDWVGSKYDAFLIQGDELEQDNKDHYNLIDDVKDELNNAITELENKKLENTAVIGALLAKCNDFWTWLQNKWW